MYPLEGYPFSRLPTFPTAQVRILCSPRMGAEFVMYLIDLPAGDKGEFPAETGIETFFYVMSGTGKFKSIAGIAHDLTAGSFGLTPPDCASKFVAETPLQLLVLRKRYEPAQGIEMFKGVYGNAKDVPATPFANNPNSLLQLLIPDEFQFDMSMNIFTFTPGYGLPYVETHIMEHGLYFLQGKGVYFLDGTWMEVDKDDFIWMGPYCPQSFYATGPTPSKYIYYKNVNRDVKI